jgi:hypothetical protein
MSRKSHGLQPTSKTAKATPFLPLDISYISSQLHVNLTPNILFSGLQFIRICLWCTCAMKYQL